MVRINFNQIILLACQQSKSPCIIALDNGGSKAPIRLSGRGRSCLVQLLNLGCLGQAWCQRRVFSPIQPSLSFCQYDLYLETWSWSPLICAEKAPSQGSGYMELHENMYQILCFSFTIYLSAIYLFVYYLFYIYIRAMFDLYQLITKFRFYLSYFYF